MMTIPVPHRRVTGVLALCVPVLALASLAAAQPDGRRPGARPDGGGRMQMMQEGRGGGPGAGGIPGFQRGGFGGFQQLVEPEFVRRDLLLFERELHLDRTQSQIVEILFMDYEQGWADASRAMRERLQGLRGNRNDPESQARNEARAELRTELDAIREAARGGDEAAMADLRTRMSELRDRMRELAPPRPSADELAAIREAGQGLLQEWEGERSRLRSALLTGVRTILSPDQAVYWAGFNHALRREKLVPLGSIAGESIDLIALMRSEGIGAEEMAQFEDVVMAYAQELDAALVARQSVLDEQRGAFLGFLGGGDGQIDVDGMRRGLQREADARVRVREVNERYGGMLVEEIVAVRGARAAEAFVNRVHDAAYRPLIRQSALDRWFRRVGDMPEADDETLEMIRDIEGSWRPERDRLEENLIEVARREQPRDIVARADRMQQMQQFRENERALRDAMAEREQRPLPAAQRQLLEHDHKVRADLASVLGPELVEALRLPEIRLPGEGRRRGGPGEAIEGGRRGQGGEGQPMDPAAMRERATRGMRERGLSEDQINEILDRMGERMRRGGGEGGPGRGGAERGGGGPGGDDAPRQPRRRGQRVE